MSRALALLTTALLMAGCAPTGAGSPGGMAAAGDSTPRQCFRSSQIRNFRPGGAQQLYIRAQDGAVYGIRASACLELGTTNAMTITPATGPSDRLCVGDSARIDVLGATLRQGPCAARVHRVLTEAEVEALPSRQRP
jgi:hypothetical protein